MAKFKKGMQELSIKLENYFWNVSEFMVSFVFLFSLFIYLFIFCKYIETEQKNKLKARQKL
jgi:hypothetical protein